MWLSHLSTFLAYVRLGRNGMKSWLFAAMFILPIFVVSLGTQIHTNKIHWTLWYCHLWRLWYILGFQSIIRTFYHVVYVYHIYICLFAELRDLYSIFQIISRCEHLYFFNENPLDFTKTWMNDHFQSKFKKKKKNDGTWIYPLYEL